MKYFFKNLEPSWKWTINQLNQIVEFFKKLLPSSDLKIDVEKTILLLAILMIALGLILFFRKPLKTILNKIETMIFTEFKEYKRAAYFAVKIESRIRYLNGLSVPEKQSKIDLVNILKSSILLLDRFIEVMEHRNKLNPANEIDNLVVEQPEIINLEDKADIKILPEIPEEPKLSETAKELIKLRDSVMLANTGDKIPNSDVLEVLYQRLGKVLEKEGVDTLDKVGKFDVERQEVVSTKETDDPELDEVVSETVRPGYLFAGNLFRSQQVIIYRFKESH
ncbi:MAG: nucleotide exchange factor GrpE [Rivularia sp. (in: cyanobacteria)]